MEERTSGLAALAGSFGVVIDLHVASADATEAETCLLALCLCHRPVDGLEA